MKQWFILFVTVAQIVAAVYTKDISDINILHRAHGSQQEDGKYLIDTEIHLRNNALGKALFLDNGTSLGQYSSSSIPSFGCLRENEPCLWTKSDGWSVSPVSKDELDSFVLHVSELQSPCQNDNGGCQVYCSNEPTGPECSCPFPGFSLSPDNKTCIPDSETHSLLFGNEGSFTSNNYPENYENNEERNWLLVAPHGRRIKLIIPELELETDEDIVTIYDYSNEWNEINKWTGALDNLTTESSGNLMWISFQSDESLRNKGFKASYKTEGDNYNTLLLNSNNGHLSTNLNSFPSQLCLTITYKLAPSGTIDVVIQQEEENDKTFSFTNIQESNGWVTGRFKSPILPDDKEEKLSLQIQLTGQNSKIFHVTECNPNDESDVYITHSQAWKLEDLFVPQLLKPDETGHCHNGGTFLPSQGVCECPVGFNGPTCQEACGPNHYGRNCSEECSCFQQGCKNIMFCKYINHTSSCSCASGYTGKACSKECSSGYYGVNCASKCGQCRSGLCNTYTGKCNGECEDGFYPPLCQERYVMLLQAPKIEERNYNSVLLSTDLSQYEGKGTPYLFQVQYKEVDGMSWIVTQTEEMKNHLTRKNITGLQAGTKYLFRVVLISDDGNRYEGSLVPVAGSETTCEVPHFKQYQIITKNLTSSGFLVQWKFEILKNDWCSIIAYNIILQGRWIRIFKNLSFHENSFVTYTNLLPAHKYDVSICAVTRKGESCSSPIAITTKEEEPGDVTDLKAIPLQGGKLKISWSKPFLRPGNVTEYKLQFQCLQHLLCGESCDSSRGELNIKENEVELDNLLPLAQYKIQVAAVTTSEGPYTHVFTATKSNIPSTPPRNSVQPIVSKTNTSAMLEWKAPICRGLNGELKGYHYILTAQSEDRTEEVKILEGLTNISQVSFSSLTPSTNYQAFIHVLNSQGWNRDYNITIPFSTSGTVPDTVEVLEVFKKGRRMIGIRWANPKKTYGAIKSFTIKHHQEGAETGVSELINPTFCSGWPHLYCHTITGLRPEKNYSIEVRARNNEIDEDGPAAVIVATTREYAPDAPSYLKILTSNSHAFDIEWGSPKKFNGELRAFILNVEHEDSLKEEECCEYFPVQELPLREEQPVYNLQVSGLNPASRYVISVSGKTITLGPSINITGYTAPLSPTDLVPPEIVKLMDGGIMFSAKIQPVEINPKIDGDYLVLILPGSNISTSDIWDQDLSNKLRSEVNESFYIISEFNKDDLLQEKEIKLGTGKETINGTIGLIQDPTLSPGTYRVGLALVVNYNGAKSVGFVSSEPFKIES